MNHLYIYNRPVDTLEDLKSLMLAFKDSKDDSPLSVDLIDNFVDGNIETFLRTIEESTLADHINQINPNSGDSKIRQELIKAICNDDVNVNFNPLQFVEVVEADVVDSKGVLKIKVLKKAVETIPVSIRVPQIKKKVLEDVNIKEHHVGEIITLELEVPEREEEYEVEFYIGEKIIRKTTVYSNMSFPVDGEKFKMIRVEGHPEGTFYLGETQVTRKLWKSIAQYVQSLDEDPSFFKGDDNRPVEKVSCQDCDKFIEELNKRLKEKLPEGYHFALPTESQWEYAARGGDKTRGFKFSGCNKMRELKQYAWYRENASDYGPDHPNYGTHPVKSRKPNELNLYDMSGNVWEWCADWVWYNPSGSRRVLRGGSWLSDAESCRVANGSSGRPGYRSDDVGFRLALVQQ